MVLSGAARGDIVYDVATQFDASNNPSTSSPWSYGSRDMLGGVLSLYTATQQAGPVSAWHSGMGPASATRNFSGSAFANGTVRWLGGQAVFHPQFNGNVSVFRFTVPEAGLYEIAASFSGNDVVGTTTDVHVLVDDVSIFDGSVNSAWSDPATPGAGPSFATATPLNLTAGSRIDFAVGWRDGDYHFDATGVMASIIALSSIPGDANGDGCVSGADFTIWNDNFGLTPASLSEGDFNDDDIVSGADFTVWNDHFGEGCAPTAAVPEPQSWAMALAGLVCAWGILVTKSRTPPIQARSASE